MKAFMAAKTSVRNKSEHGQFYVEVREFRLLL